MIALLWKIALLTTLLATLGAGATAQQSPLKAAASKIDITPKRPVYLAGYGSNRRSTSFHDSIWARCLVMESGGTRIAFVSCDVIGMPRYQNEQIRAQVKSVKPENLYIAATHTHSGPDTLGQWGPDMQTSGIDKAWFEETKARIVKLVDETASKLEPVSLKSASTTKVPPVSRNARVKEILDTELAVMQAISTATKKPIATFVNFACHPEVLNCHALTADFPNWLYQTVEANGGGVCLYLNGAQGGMITADFDESIPPKNENFKAAETIGTSLANRALEILKDAPEANIATIRTQRSVFSVPMESELFKALIVLKVFPQNILKNGAIETEVNRIQIGDTEMLTLPGEVLPNIGFMLKRYMTGKTKFLLGLTCDELGYILSEEDFGLKLYEYESRVSVGSQMGPLMVQNLKKLLAQK